MRKSLLLAAALVLAAQRCVEPRQVRATNFDLAIVEDSRPRRKLNKTANKLRTFMGYTSDRKGKGEKKREASARKLKGWK